MNNFRRISKMLALRAKEVSQYLLPNGVIAGHEYCVGCIEGKAGKSLKVCIGGEKSGFWCDFATGQRGDLIDLWSLTRKISLMAALVEAEEYLGVDKPKFDAYKQKKFTKPSIKAEFVASQSPVMNYLTQERKLSVNTIELFEIREQGSQIVFPYVCDGEIVFIKYLEIERPQGKKKIYIEKNCEPCLFGWQALSPNMRDLTIVEGEIDCMSLHQYGINALSVPFGGGAGGKHEWIEYEFERLAAFDEIFLCFDADDAGKAATHELVKRLGEHRCRIVMLPYKDPNECLQKGLSQDEIQKCFKQARKLDPDELKPASLYVDQVIDEFYPKEGFQVGYHSPWMYVKGKVLFRPDELSIWGGFNGHGKSQLLGHLILGFMKQGAHVCIASLEIKPKKLLMRLTRQAASLKEPTPDYIRAIHEWYEDKLWLFDLVGTAKVDRLLEVFLYARQRYGIDVFVIDSFMKCGIDEEDFRSQKAFLERLCDFKNQYNCHIHLVVHPRKSGDESQIPGKLDCKGTGAITDLADNCFTVWRNKAKEEIIQMQINGVTLDTKQSAKLDECDCILRCDKQRNGEWEGKTALWFNRDSFQYVGRLNQKPTQFVDYSKCGS